MIQHYKGTKKESAMQAPSGIYHFFNVVEHTDTIVPFSKLLSFH